MDNHEIIERILLWAEKQKEKPVQSTQAKDTQHVEMVTYENNTIRT
jgi:hypothetical protein